MSGWSALAWLSACTAGVVLFLKFVANEIASVVDALKLLEHRERKAHRRRLEEADAAAAEVYDAQTVTDEAA